MSDRMPKYMPGRMSECTSFKMTASMSTALSDKMSDGLTGSISFKTSSVMSEYLPRRDHMKKRNCVSFCFVACALCALSLSKFTLAPGALNGRALAQH